MLRKILCLLVIGWFSQSVWGQLSVSYENDSIVLMQNLSEYVPVQMVNQSANDIQVDIIRLENNLPSNWYSGLCVDICSLSIVDSIRITIPANSAKQFKMYFQITQSAFADTAHTKVLFREVVSGMSQELDFYAYLNALGISVLDKETKYKIYPNPANVSQIINVEGLDGSEKISLFDFQGNQIYFFNGTDGQLMLPQNLAAGNYLLHINDSGQMRKLLIK